MLGRAVQVPGDTRAGPDSNYGHGRLDANFTNASGTPTPTVPPTPSPRPPAGGGGGGGGCRIVDPGNPGSGWWLLVVVAVVAVKGVLLARRS